jgi:hypothetical protein
MQQSPSARPWWLLPLALSLGCADGTTGTPDASRTGDATVATGTSTSTSTSTTPTTGTVTLTVDTTAVVRPISPLIYGLNSTDEIATTKPTVIRSGGNRLTAHNWENNASNAGADWQFQNDNYLVSKLSTALQSTPGQAVQGLIETSHAQGAAALLTIPNVDYVAADKAPSGDVRNSGADYLQTRFKKNVAKKGAALSLTPDPDDDSVYQDEFVNWAVTTFPTGELLFDLDNEPGLWSQTHAEVHPEKVTYAELVERNTRFATAIKDVAPTAKVLGFVSYGWNAFLNLQDAPDSKTNGDFIDYYLKAMQAAGAQAGKRLVDFLDLHWYPEATGGGDDAGDGGVRITGGAGGANVTPAVVEARVQAPRSLWDPSYTEASWITKWSTQGPIRLIPRIREKLDANYPGTGLAITEWNYGGGKHISGAIASADVLGIFGREGVGVACNWGFGADEVYMRAAFRAYRNYDGAGGHFGDTSVTATTSDIEATSVYASVESTAPDRVVIVAINKRTYPVTATLAVTHASSFQSADVFTLTSAGPNLVPAAGIAATAANQFQYVMPAQSVSVLVPKP